MTKPKSTIVAGVMSGTSADGVDVALCRISASATSAPRVKLIGMASFPYSKSLRTAVLAAMDAKSISAAELSRLHWRLGEVYAGAVEATATEFSVNVDLVGCHGQTIYHQGAATRYLGKPVRCTWQIGEASVIAERLHTPVVSDFRPADLAAGGQGAPLVPVLDYVMFRSPKRNRVLQNLGGIANLTAIPAGASEQGVVAFDT
ncbi:MAG: anhydro-N-acetylmuramic acid kinase, partial [Acidobacteria bacterium]|nr:anhydro-N-acetylmuramic acid kinase [Acidobacteriota bacterium]